MWKTEDYYICCYIVSFTKHILTKITFSLQRGDPPHRLSPKSVKKYRKAGGKMFPTTGQMFPTTCEMFPTTGQMFPTTCQMFPTTGQMFPTTGHMFPTTGQMFPTTCQMFPTTCQMFPTTGQMFPTTGQMFPTTGRLSVGFFKEIRGCWATLGEINSAPNLVKIQHTVFVANSV